jgi:hypothetical protein
MGLRYNPFNGSFDFTRSPASYMDGEVATFADLPLSATAAPLNSAWLVRQASGVYFLARKPAGIYIRTATGGTDRNADYTYASAFPDVFSDANFTVYDDADATRSMQIQVADNQTLTFKVTGSDNIVRSVAFPLSAILLAALMFASSALAQNIGIVTGTNGTVITGRTNTLTFSNKAVFPAQTADSGTSLMTRDLSDARYSFSQWYTGYELLALDNTTGALKTLNSGNSSGGIFDNQMVAVTEGNSKFNLPIDWRVTGQVKIISYWSDRGATNVGGTNANIAVMCLPWLRNPTNNTASSGGVSGTQITNVFTATYGGTGRYYIVEQTLDFATVSGINATNPLQVKFVEFQRRGSDAIDTSTNTIWLSGVHIYVP